MRAGDIVASWLGMLLIVAPVGAEMYKVIGANGKVSYTDRLGAANGRQQVTEMSVSSYSGPGLVGTAPGTTGKSGMTKSVVIYSTAWCPSCKQAKSYLSGKGIAYRDIDVEKDASGRDAFRRLGGRGVPLIVIGGQTLTGFSPERIDAMLASGS